MPANDEAPMAEEQAMDTDKKRHPTDTHGDPKDSSKIAILPIRRRNPAPPEYEHDGEPPDSPPPAA